MKNNNNLSTTEDLMVNLLIEENNEKNENNGGKLFSKEISKYCEFYHQEPKSELYIGIEEKENIDEWGEYVKNKEDKKHSIFYLQNKDKGHNKEIAFYVAKKLGFNLIFINSRLFLNENLSLDTVIDSIKEICGDNKYLPCLNNFEVCLANKKDNESFYEKLFEAFAKHYDALFVMSSVSTEPLVELQDNYWIYFNFPVPNKEIRKEIWKDLLGDDLHLLKKLGLEELSHIYKLNKTQIEQAYYQTRNLCLIYNGEKREKEFEKTLIESCLTQNSQMLSKLAVKIESKETLEDVVLPPDQLRNINEIIMYVRQEKKAHELSGLGNRSYGKGINVLFTGVSGTGKTLTALVIGNELGLPVYKIDLSAITSKWVGETEKNLSKLFDEAKNLNVILIFDEADSIFGKRSEIESSQDKYGNTQVGFLLQKLEEHEGICVLTSNLEQNIDSAFKRRFKFIIRFPFPKEKERKAIWGKTFADNSKLSNDVSLDYLAKHLEITGANIKNVAILSSVYALEESTSINMNHILLGVKREYEKTGEIFLPDDFPEHKDIAEKIYEESQSESWQKNKSDYLNLLTDVEKAISKFITNHIPELSEKGKIVTDSPSKVKNIEDSKLSLFLYNFDWVSGESQFPSQASSEYSPDYRSQLAFNLYYILTPFSENKVKERYLFQRLNVLFANYNELDDAELSPNLIKSGNEKLRMEVFELYSDNEHTKIWDKFNIPFKPSLCLKISTVYIPTKDKEEDKEVMNQGGLQYGL